MRPCRYPGSSIISFCSAGVAAVIKSLRLPSIQQISSAGSCSSRKGTVTCAIRTSIFGAMLMNIKADPQRIRPVHASAFSYTPYASCTLRSIVSWWRNVRLLSPNLFRKAGMKPEGLQVPKVYLMVSTTAQWGSLKDRAGAISTAPRQTGTPRSLYRSSVRSACAVSSETAPPIEPPMTKKGRVESLPRFGEPETSVDKVASLPASTVPGAISAAISCTRSSTRSSCERSSARSPSEYPCPIWSIRTTAAPPLLKVRAMVRASTLLQWPPNPWT
mmetsp:Transcript_33250/g.73272  ORF Transcript_33250/g.73272 Transcript_33250/m.73272 type:complete len:274 (+) Transcript_33250:421-1242(+)